MLRTRLQNSRLSIWGKQLLDTDEKDFSPGACLKGRKKE